MKQNILIFCALLCGAAFANAQSVGQVGLAKYTATGLQYSWLTPTGGVKYFGVDVNGNVTLSAVSGGSGAWADITGKPSTFPPEAHTQAIPTITGLQTALDGKQAASTMLTTLSQRALQTYGLELMESGDADTARNHLGLGASGSVTFDILDLGSITASGDISATGNITGGQIQGSGLFLTALNASELTSGEVPRARLGTGTASASTFLRGDGTWAASGAVTGMTGTANQITVTGTTTPTLSLPATITGLSSVTSTTFVGAVTGTASGNLPLAGGTMAGNLNLFSSAQGFTFSNSAQFIASSNGTALASFDGGASCVNFGSNGVGFGSSTAYNNVDVRLRREAANRLSQRNATAAQRFEVANTYTATTNNEVAVLDWQTTTNTLRIGSSKGSGGGSNRAVHFIMGDTVEMRFDADGNVILPLLPTTAPATSGALWRDAANGNVLKVVP